MASKLSFPSFTVLPIPTKFFQKQPQKIRIPVFPLHLPYNSYGHRFFGQVRSSSTRKVTSSSSSYSPSSVSDAVEENVVESPASDSSQDSQDNPLTSSSSKLVLVVGGSGGVGQLVVASLLSRNITARLILRDPEKATTLFGEQDKEKLQVVKGDTRNPLDLDPSMFEGVTDVICCTGTTAFPSRRWDGDNTPERVDWEGVRNLVSTLPSSLKRFILVSSIGVTKFNELPWRLLKFLQL